MRVSVSASASVIAVCLLASTHAHAQNTLPARAAAPPRSAPALRAPTIPPPAPSPIPPPAPALPSPTASALPAAQTSAPTAATLPEAQTWAPTAASIPEARAAPTAAALPEMQLTALAPAPLEPATTTTSPPDPPPTAATLSAPRDEAARPLFEAGRRAYEAGHYADALDAFQRVFVMTGHPAMLINIAKAHIRLNEPRRAAASLQQYLALVPQAQNRALLQARIVELQDAPLVLESGVAAAPSPLAPPPPAPHGLIAGRTWTWVALGTSLVLSGVAAVLWMNANQSFERLALTCGSRGSCSDAQIETVTGGVSATNVCLAGSGIALGLSLVLFFAEGSGNTDRAATTTRAPRVVADVHAHGATLSLTGKL